MQRSVSSTRSAHSHPPNNIPPPTSAHTLSPLSSNIHSHINLPGQSIIPAQRRQAQAQRQRPLIPPLGNHVNNLVRLRGNISSRVSRDPRDSQASASGSSPSPRSRASAGHSSGGYSSSRRLISQHIALSPNNSQSHQSFRLSHRRGSDSFHAPKSPPSTSRNPSPRVYAVASPGLAVAVAKALASSIHMDEKDIDGSIRINKQSLTGAHVGNQRQDQYQDQGEDQDQDQGEGKSCAKEGIEGIENDEMEGGREEEPIAIIPSLSMLFSSTDGTALSLGSSPDHQTSDELRQATTTAAALAVDTATITATAQQSDGCGGDVDIANGIVVGGVVLKNPSEGPLLPTAEYSPECPPPVEFSPSSPSSARRKDSIKNHSLQRSNRRVSSLSRNMDKNDNDTNSTRRRSSRGGSCTNLSLHKGPSDRVLSDRVLSYRVLSDRVLSGSAVTGMDRKSFRVLVVDDSSMTRKMLMKTLRAEVTTNCHSNSNAPSTNTVVLTLSINHSLSYPLRTLLTHLLILC